MKYKIFFTDVSRPDFLESYREISKLISEQYHRLLNAKYNDGKRIFSDECISQMEEIDCSPMYCSANESQLLIKHDKEDCYQIIKNW